MSQGFLSVDTEADSLRRQLQAARAEVQRLTSNLDAARDCGKVCGTAGEQCQACLRRMLHVAYGERDAAQEEARQLRAALEVARDVIVWVGDAAYPLVREGDKEGPTLRLKRISEWLAENGPRAIKQIETALADTSPDALAEVVKQIRLGQDSIVALLGVPSLNLNDALRLLGETP